MVLSGQVQSGKEHCLQCGIICCASFNLELQFTLKRRRVIMYKIMLLVRDSETKPLWTEYREDGTVFETDDMDALVEKVRELFDRYTRTQIGRAHV